MRVAFVIAAVTILGLGGACGSDDSSSNVTPRATSQKTGGSPADAVPSATDEPSATVQATESAVPDAFFCLWVNSAKAPFGDSKFTEALLAAIDPAAIDEELLPRRVVAMTGTAPEVIGSPACLASAQRYDLSRARQLLAESAYAQDTNRAEIWFAYLLNADASAIAHLLKEVWKRDLNVDVRLFVHGNGGSLKSDIDRGSSNAFLIVLPP